METIAEEELVFLVRPGWFKDDVISTDELLATRLTLTESIHKRLERELSSPLMVDMKLNSIELIRKLLQNGAIASVLPHSAVRDEIAAGTIQAVRIGKEGLFRRLVLCSSQTRRTSTATRVVLDVMIELAKEMSQEGYFNHASFQEQNDE